MSNFPTSGRISNSDEHTIDIEESSFPNPRSMGVTINQTTAIRIDDSNVSPRETWSSQRITEMYANTIKVEYGTTASWEARPLFVPDDGEFIVYTDKRTMSNIVYPGIKIGNGESVLANLPFLNDDDTQIILSNLNSHANNQDIHVTPSEKQSWNDKLNYLVTGELLEFTRD